MNKASEFLLGLFPQKLLLTLDIQFFSEDPDPADPNPPADPTPPAPPADPTPGTQLSLDVVQSWLNEQEDGKKWLQSFSDTRVTEAIKTYKEKTLPKLLDEEIQKRYPAETEEQKKIRDLQMQMEQFQQQAQREKLNNVALSKATEAGVPSSLVQYLVGADEETTISNIEAFQTEFDKAVQLAVDKKFAAGGYTPPKPQGNNDTIDAQIEQARLEAQQKGTAEARARYAELKVKKQTAQ